MASCVCAFAVCRYASRQNTLVQVTANLRHLTINIHSGVVHGTHAAAGCEPSLATFTALSHFHK